VHRLIERGDYRFFTTRAAAHVARLLGAPRRALALPLRRPLRRVAPREPDRHRQGRRARGALVHMVRTFPPACRWQSSAAGTQSGRRSRPHAGRGLVRMEGGALRPLLGREHVRGAHADPRARRGAPRAAEPRRERRGTRRPVQRRWALEELGYPVWGLSPSSTPGNDGYGEYGVRVLGSLGYVAGAVTPHAVALALGVSRPPRRRPSCGSSPTATTSTASTASTTPSTRAWARWRTRTSPSTRRYFHRGGEYLQEAAPRHFTADPIAARALAVIGEERFFD